MSKAICYGILRVIIAYSLCIFYSATTLLVLLYNYWRKHETKFWIPKTHTIPPRSLSNPEFGEHKYIMANGLKFHYVEKGNPDKPLMLFIHGFPEFWYSWRFQLKEFSKEYRAVAIDMRGYGDSDKPSGWSHYHIKSLVEDIKCLIEALGHDKCILVCHDWGAVIGWSFISAHMNMVEKYVMMGAPSLDVWGKSMMQSLEQFRKSWYVFYFLMPALPEFTTSLNDYAMLKVIGGFKFSENFTEEDLEAYKYTFSKNGALTGPINYYRHNMNFFATSKRPTPATFAPGMFILGERDAYIAASTGPILKKRFENLRFEVVPGANHFVQQDAPEKTNQLLWEFLKH